MTQHTAQHMLSHALLDAGAPTVSARLGARTFTIDLGGAPLDRSAIRAAEDRVNELISENRPIRVLYPSPAELASMELFSAPKVADAVRVISIEGFDATPCGGTHCSSTSEIGWIHIIGIERYKGMTRVTALAGAQALEDYQAKDEVLQALCQETSTAPSKLVDAVMRLRDECKRAADAAKILRRQFARELAAALLARFPSNEVLETLIPIVRSDGDVELIREIASALATRPDVVAAAACPDGEGYCFVIERGTAARIDVGQCVKRFFSTHSGRGGGAPTRAEGRLGTSLDWESLLEVLKDKGV